MPSGWCSGVLLTMPHRARKCWLPLTTGRTYVRLLSRVRTRSSKTTLCVTLAPFQQLNSEVAEKGAISGYRDGYPGANRLILNVGVKDEASISLSTTAICGMGLWVAVAAGVATHGRHPSEG